MTEKRLEKNQLNMGKVQYIKPIFPNDAEVLKKTADNGDEIYYHAPDNELRTCDTDLETAIACLLEPLQIIDRVLCEVLSDSDNLAIANLFTVIKQNISNNLYEIFRFIDQSIGEIRITEVCELKYGDGIHRWGQCVGVKIIPPEVAKTYQEGPVYDHNPALIHEAR